MRRHRPTLPDATARLIGAYGAHVLEERYRTERTWADYRRILASFFAFAGKPPAEVGPADLRAFLTRPADQHTSARGERLADSTRRVYACAVLDAYDWWTSAGLLETNPLGLVRAPKSAEGPPRDLTVEQIHRLLDAVARIPRLRVAVWLAVEAGMRCGELAGARIEDVRLGSQPLIHIRGKGGRERDVPLNRLVTGILNNYLADRPGVGPLIPSVRDANRHVTPKTMSYLLGGALRAAGLAGISSHALRHTFATWALEASDRDIYTVRDLLGHKSVRTTERYIGGHVGPAREVVERVGQIDPRREATP